MENLRRIGGCSTRDCDIATGSARWGTLIALVLICSVSFLSSCSSLKIETFEGKEPRFRPEEFFVGQFEGHGVFFDRFDSVRRSFIITIKGYKENGLLILDEHLLYDDGEALNRRYKIRKESEHYYVAEADGLVGQATILSYGNALNWRYTLAQKIGERTWNLHFDDWMFLMNDELVLNRAWVRKFGLEVGQVQLSLRKIGNDVAKAAGQK
jgi:hypothetical protein